MFACKSVINLPFILTIASSDVIARFKICLWNRLTAVRSRLSVVLTLIRPTYEKRRVSEYQPCPMWNVGMWKCPKCKKSTLQSESWLCLIIYFVILIVYTVNQLTLMYFDRILNVKNRMAQVVLSLKMKNTLQVPAICTVIIPRVRMAKKIYWRCWFVIHDVLQI